MAASIRTAQYVYDRKQRCIRWHFVCLYDYRVSFYRAVIFYLYEERLGGVELFQYDNKLTLISEYVLQQQNSDEILADTAIIIYLYYEDTLDMYLDYIDNIPEKIKVVIITSNSTVKNIIEKWKSIHNKKFEVRLKENRGRFYE